MNDNARLGLWVISFAVLILFLVGILIGESIGQKDTRKKAIAAGKAKYIVDERTGVTQFVFITNSIPAK